jgi:hypothetical protein
VQGITEWLNKLADLDFTAFARSFETIIDALGKGDFSTAGSILTDWIGVAWAKIKDAWGLISPALSALWGNLTSWITDAGKRTILVNGALSLFGALWDWATGLWESSIKGALGAMWLSLTSWVTDSTKRAQLWAAVVGAWTSFTDWAVGVWAAVQPGLAGHTWPRGGQVLSVGLRTLRAGLNCGRLSRGRGLRSPTGRTRYGTAAKVSRA